MDWSNPEFVLGAFVVVCVVGGLLGLARLVYKVFFAGYKSGQHGNNKDL